MSTLQLGVPIAIAIGTNQRTHARRRFNTAGRPRAADGHPMSTEQLAAVLRDFLAASQLAEWVERRPVLLSQSSVALTSSDELILAVTDDVWERHGLYPIGPWEPVGDGPASR